MTALLSSLPQPVTRRIAVPGLPDPGRCLVMGILNVTPDSFSDGGRHVTAGRAIVHGLRLAEAGADIIDIGGESTRPGAARVPLEAELSRTIPVVRELAREGLVVSIDTMRAAVAQAAITAGATLVNDVSGGLADEAMARCVAAAGVPFVAMHWRAPSTTMHRHAVYGDVVEEVSAELLRRVESLRTAGIDGMNIILDPGLGFAKTGVHDWELLRRLAQLADLGHPILVGASRKSLLRPAIVAADGSVPPPVERDGATAAVSGLAAAAGAWCVRVHEPASTLAAVRVSKAWFDDYRVPAD